MPRPAERLRRSEMVMEGEKVAPGRDLNQDRKADVWSLKSAILGEMGLLGVMGV